MRHPDLHTEFNESLGFEKIVFEFEDLFGAVLRIGTWLPAMPLAVSISGFQPLSTVLVKISVAEAGVFEPQGHG